MTVFYTINDDLRDSNKNGNVCKDLAKPCFVHHRILHFSYTVEHKITNQFASTRQNEAIPFP